MDRRGPARFILALLVAAVWIVGPLAPGHVAGSAPPSTQPAEPSDEPGADRTVPTVSDFYPEDNNLSDCVGLVERPGCGSESRGGSGQVAVFAVLIAGLGLIFWRISVGVRRNRVDPPSEEPAPDYDESRP